VEVKNIGSISVLEKVIDFEIERQSRILDEGKTPINETRGLRDQSGETFSQRNKESEAEYRYFPEPDIPPIEISDEWIETLRKEIPELPADRKNRYMSELGLEAEQADILVEQREKGDYIDSLLSKGLSKDELKEIVKWFIGDISGLLDKNGKTVSELRTTPDDLVFLIKELRASRISGAIVKKVLEIQNTDGGRAEEIVNVGGLTQISDISEIDRLVDQTITDNPKVVESLSKNPNALKALVGYVMKLSKGKANPKMSEEIIKKKLGISF
jgi:aspartyl-tRNA(Asn)/glutamyl-tRNA(Gln) amidotransferase subunit B